VTTTIDPGAPAPRLGGDQEHLATVGQRLADRVERALESALPAAGARALEAFGAARLVDSMRYSLGTPGKRIRPLLLMGTTSCLTGGDVERAIGAAVGLEMIHAYSLIHDDLPAMDDDDLRRGQPTNHMVYGEGMAILAGDGLLTEAFLSLLDPAVEPALQVEVARMIATAAGREGMVGGQAADLEAEGVEPSEAVVRSIHARKTGALLRVAVRAGAVLGGADTAELEGLTAFAERFGIAFQIADDVKDEIAPTAVSGKQGGGDRQASKMTYPVLYGVEGSLDLCRRELAEAVRHLQPWDERFALLEHLALASVAPAFREDLR
jgi:geranylgeranyl diphosphate synthase type II